MNFYEQIFSRGRATGEGMTHFERLFAAKFGGSPPPEVREYTGAVPVTITADGTPLIDLLISGNEEHTGTPTPDNPIMPQGTGERTGNLWNEDYTGIDWNLKYVPVFVGEGTFTLSTNTPDYSRNAPLFLLSGNVTSGASTPVNGVYNGLSRTTDSSNGYITIAFRRQSESSYPITHKTMLNSGSAPLPYEPYGYKIPILSGGTTTPVYLGEVQTTRKIKKLVLDGTENWTLSNNRLMYTVKTTKAISYESVVCTHFISAKSFMEVYNTINSIAVTNQGIYVNSGSTDIADFKSYLQQQYANGTPVTVWYVLAEPTTGIVNEPLMKIGTYADTLSKAQAGVTIPTNNGSTTVDVDTDVKPSEIYIKYMG